MPVLVFYKEKTIPVDTASDISESLANVTKELLDASIEIRVLEPVTSFNANKVHIEMRFRDFGERSDEQLSDYHRAVMELIGRQLERHNSNCKYSFYIIPSQPPRSMWAQAGEDEEG